MFSELLPAMIKLTERVRIVISQKSLSFLFAQHDFSCLVSIGTIGDCCHALGEQTRSFVPQLVPLCLKCECFLR